MKDKLSILKNLDYFANPFQVTFKNKTYFSSWLGVFLTLSILVFAVVITITTGTQLFKKTKPSVNQNDIYQFIPDNYTLSSNLIPFTYSYPGDVDKFLDSSYFNVKVYNYLNRRYIDDNGDPVFNSNKYSLEFELCKNNPEKYLERFSKLGNFTESLIKDYFYERHICIKSDNITVGGNYNSNFFSNILIEVYKCANSTENNNFCKTEEEMINVALGVNFAFNYVDTIPISTNYDEPFQRVLTNYYLKLDPNIYQSVDLYFSKITMITDAGFMFEENVTKTGYKFDRFREIYTMTPPKNRVLRLYFNISQNVIEISRYYMKIQELVALVGGILKASLIVGFAITKFFYYYLFDELLINTFFDPLNTNKDGIRNIKPIFSSKTVKLVNLNSDKINKLSPDIRKNYLDPRKSVNRNQILRDSNVNNLNSFSDINIIEDALDSNKRLNVKNSNKIVERRYSDIYYNNKRLHDLSGNENARNTNISNYKNSERLNINNNVRKLSSNKNNLYSEFLNKENSKINKNNAIYHLGYIDIINMFLCPCRPLSKNKNIIHKLYKEKLNEYTDYSEVINEIISFRYFKEYIIYNDIDINVEGFSKVKIDFNPYIVNEDPHLKAFIQSFTHLTKERLINEKIIKRMLKLIKREQKYMD